MDIIEIKGIKIPYENINNKRYYPIKYILEKVLLKSNKQLQTKTEYEKYIIRREVSFDFCGGNTQKTFLIEEEGLTKLIETFKIGSITGEKYNRYLILCELLKIKTKYKKIKNKYNDYEQYVINNYLKNNKNTLMKVCNKCEREFPIDTIFFYSDPNSSDKLTGHCRGCNSKKGKFSIKSNRKYEYVYRNFGNDGFVALKNNIGEFYHKYIYNKSINYPNLIFSTLDKMRIIKYFYETKVLCEEDLCKKKVEEMIGIKLSAVVSNDDINKFVSNCECIVKPYKYKYYKNEAINMELAKIIYLNYISDNNIKIDNILNYEKYDSLINNDMQINSKIRSIDGGILELLVKIYEYPGYKFKYRSKRYYNYKDNRIYDLKYLIERDLKIETNKIPLYLTKYVLLQKARPIYTWMRSKGKEVDLFKLIDECYPNKFIREDFNINPYRSRFDSMEESQINDILKKEFNAVIYNERNNENEFEIGDKKPDWIILTEHGCYIVEYFGLYEDKENMSSRGKMYKDKMNDKLKQYKKLLGYNFLFIYPIDLKNNFEGLYKKIKKIKSF